MANIQQIAESLVDMTTAEVNEIATVLRDEYGIEAKAYSMEDNVRRASRGDTMSPREYGMSIRKRNKKHRK